MNARTFQILAYVSGLFIFIILIILYYINYRGDFITNRQATIVCAGLVNEKVTKDFDIIGVNFNPKYSFTLIRVGVSLKYPNKGVQAECLIKKRIVKNIVRIQKASLPTLDDKVIILSNVKVLYNQ